MRRANWNGRYREARPRPPTRRPARSPAAQAATLVVLRRWAATVCGDSSAVRCEPLKGVAYQSGCCWRSLRGGFATWTASICRRRRPAYRRCYTDVTVAMIDQGLLEGAHRAIERWGWRQATLERIATEAGVSRMTLHRRGVTRDGLLGALSERLEDDYRSSMWPALTASGSGRERLEQALAGYCEAVEANLELAGRAGRGRPQRDLPRGGPARPDPPGLHRADPPAAAGRRRRRLAGRRGPRGDRDAAAQPRQLDLSPPAPRPRLGRRARPRRRAAHRAGRGGRAVSAGLDRRGLAVLASGHACADMAQGAIPALLPFLIDQRGISYGAAGALDPRHERRVVGHPAALRPGLRSPRAAVADAARRAARRAGRRPRRRSRRATRPPPPRWRSAASASRPSIPRGRASPTRSRATAAGRG